MLRCWRSARSSAKRSSEPWSTLASGQRSRGMGPVASGGNGKSMEIMFISKIMENHQWFWYDSDKIYQEDPRSETWRRWPRSEQWVKLSKAVGCRAVWFAPRAAEQQRSADMQSLKVELARAARTLNSAMFENHKLYTLYTLYTSCTRCTCVLYSEFCVNVLYTCIYLYNSVYTCVYLLCVFYML